MALVHTNSQWLWVHTQNLSEINPTNHLIMYWNAYKTPSKTEVLLVIPGSLEECDRTVDGSTPVKYRQS